MRVVFLFLFLSFLTAALSQTAASPPRHSVPFAHNLIVERIRRVEERLAPPVLIDGRPTPTFQLLDRLKYYHTPGVSIAVIDRGAIVWARGYGVKEATSKEQVTEETLFQAASISKPFAAALALHLVEQGQMDLDEDVNRKLRTWKVPASPLAKDHPVTLRRLLSHTAGISVSGFHGYGRGQPLPTRLQELDGLHPANTPPIRVEAVPGSQWSYSGGGYLIVEQLLEDVTGQTFAQALHDAVLEPLGLKHTFCQMPLTRDLTGFAASGHDAEGKTLGGGWLTISALAAGGLWSTPADIARFAIAIQKANISPKRGALRPEAVRTMLTEQRNGYGLGLFLRGTGRSLRFEHTGHNTGYRCIMTAYANTGQGAVIMANAEGSSSLIREILRSIAVEYHWADLQPKRHRLVKADPKTYREYVGAYQFAPDTNFVVSQEGNRLYLLAPPLGKQKVELYPEAPGRFFALADDVTFTFVRNAGGKVVEMVVRPPDGVFHAKRIP